MTRKYNGVDYILDESKHVVILKPEYHNLLLNSKSAFQGFKLFGGSSIADILETDSFKSQFGAFCHMARLKLPALQLKYINAGVAVEPKIFEVLRKSSPDKKFDHIIASEVGYNYFKGLNEYIGGVPDGLIQADKNVLEMKAVNIKKYDQWTRNNNSGVPTDYIKQAQLYAYLLNYKRFTIVAAFLEDGDYADPEAIDLNQRIVKTFPYKINVEEAKDDIEKVEKFYKKYSVSGVSPQYELPRDSDQVEYLRCRNEQEWEALFNKWKAMGKVDKDLSFDKFK
ncbi:MAGa7180 family putative nuclease [Mycoplasmopsis adleri]|uniref:MAGa7180 family putative nuclease n=1 Tax=Mycoplasmopsis adleri TaxID=51362 RepID=UPI0038738701